MPQMAPLMWFNLMLMFLISFMLFMIINYFIMTPSSSNKKIKLLYLKEMTWKW